MSNTLLEVKNLKKYFPVPSGTLHAVDDVTFTLNKGETLGVVGESGCGKSTLGKTILRLTNPTAGQVIYGGQDIASIPEKDFVKLRPELQMIFQDPMSSLNPRMSVKEQIEEPLLIYKKYPDRAEREKKVLELMDTVGLARRYAETILSKGGSKPAMEMFVDFMGRKPRLDALLERDGLK